MADRKKVAENKESDYAQYTDAILFIISVDNDFFFLCMLISLTII